MATWSYNTWVILVIIGIAALRTITDGNPVKSDYLRQREQLIAEERRRRIGGSLVLTTDEKIVSDLFVQEKRKLIEDSRLNSTVYIPSISFFLSKPWIEKSTLFKLIQRMPKGATLHSHDASVVSLDWVVKNATYRDHVFMCEGKDGYIMLAVFGTPPSDPNCMWKSVISERAASGNPTIFDQRLKENLSLLSKDPLTTYSSNAQIWFRFSKFFGQVSRLINYAPIYRDYIWRMLEELRADNVQYIELRATLAGVYELDGTVHDAEFAVQLFKNVTNEFVKAFPDFSGAKVIMSGIKNVPVSTILAEVKTAMTLNQKYPDVMKGYDMAGNEDYYNPIVYFLDAVLYPSMQDPSYHLPYFFHAGETNLHGTATDYNIADAILLNSTRIGHGFALVKHPRLMQLVKERDIAIEVNPISNQVLCLVNDLRNHPMVSLLADDYPIVLGSDNYATWEALPLSHDIYVAFMDMAGEDADLTFLKQLAINSIKYSAMNNAEKSAAMKLWETKWDTFIQETIKSLHSNSQ